MQLTAKLKAEIVKENEIKNEIERKLADLEEKCTMKDENQAKKLKVENRNLQDTFENKCLELKQAKNEIETLKKEKNTLFVVLKGSKQETKELNKMFRKERVSIE